MIKNETTHAALFLRKMIITFLTVITIEIAAFTVLFVMYDIESFRFLMYIYIVQHIMFLLSILYFKDMANETLIRIYLAYIPVTLFPIACICWNSGTPVAFFWYLCVVLGAIIFDNHNFWLWITLTLIVVVLVFLLSHIFPTENLSPELINCSSVMTVIGSIIIASFCAIVHVKKINIDASVHVESLHTAAENAESIEKDKALYNDIVKYIKENKSFKNPDFNAHSLAIALNSNVTYISKAISASDSDNFNTLLNDFRINYVKSMLDNGALKKYTIDYIYTEAGYKYRSTFNAAFKSITGMTPSEYAFRQNDNDNSQL